MSSTTATTESCSTTSTERAATPRSRSPSSRPTSTSTTIPSSWCRRPRASETKIARPRQRGGRFSWSRIRAVSGRELPQDVVQDAAVAEVFELVERIDAADQRNQLDLAVRRGDLGLHALARLEVAREAVQGQGFVALEAERHPGGVAFEHQRNDAHADEVRAMDALEALGDDGANAEQVRALGRPVARGAGAVFLAGQNHERHAFRLVAHGGVVDEH